MKDIITKVLGYVKSNWTAILSYIALTSMFLCLLAFFALAPNKFWTIISLFGLLGYGFFVAGIISTTQENNAIKANCQSNQKAILKELQRLEQNYIDDMQRMQKNYMENYSDFIKTLEVHQKVIEAQKNLLEEFKPLVSVKNSEILDE